MSQKKVNRKLILAGGMAAVMVMSLSACNSTSDTSDSSTALSETAGTETVETSSQAESEASTGNEDSYNVVIEWISIGNTPSEENLQLVEEAINEITVPEINCTVTLYPVEISSLKNDTALAISTGEKLDLVVSVGTGVGDLVTQGLIENLDPYLADYGRDLSSCLGDALAGGYYDNSLYGVPNAYIQSEKYGFLARTDLLDKYGIVIDSEKLYTMDELGEIFKTVKEGEGEGFYCVAGLTSTSDLFTEYLGTVDKLGATTASGGLLLADSWDNTTIANIYSSDQYKAFANSTYNWAQAGYIPSDAASNTDDGSVQLKAGNYFGRFFYTTEGAASGMGEQIGYELTNIEMSPPYKTTDRYQNILWSVPVTSEDPQKAFEFLNLLYADNDIDTLLMYGLEGVTYNVVEENSNGDKVVDFVEGVTADTAPYFCYAGVYGDRLSWPVWVPNSISFNESLREFNNSVTNISPALGYCFELTDQVSSKYSAAFSVVQQYTPIISAGSVDPETSLAEFEKALEDAGIQDVIAENQKQLDEWLAEK